MKPASSATARAPRPSVCAEPQPLSAPRRSCRRASISAPTISSAPGTSAPRPRPMPSSCSSRRIARNAVAIADRHVDEEDPVPVERLRSARRRRAGRSRRRPPRRTVDADRLRLLVGPREQRDDHAEDDGRGQRAADALDEARARSASSWLCGRAAEQRREREQRQAAEEDPLAADEVAEAPGEQQQAAERDEVGVDDPGEARLREAEVAAGSTAARRSRSSGRG